MKLYSGPLSLFTAKVRIALAEKQLDYERIEVRYSFQNAYLPHHPRSNREHVDAVRESHPYLRNVLPNNRRIVASCPA